MNITQVSFNHKTPITTKQKSVSFQGTPDDTFVKQKQAEPETGKKSVLGGLLRLIGFKKEPKTQEAQPIIKQDITKEELTRLITSGELSVDKLNTHYTPESLVALPEKDKNVLWYAQGLIINNKGEVYKEPSTSSRYR